MTDRPVILAFDTSGAACKIAVLRGTELLAGVTESMSKGQAERLMVLCGDMLCAARIDTSAIDAIGVGTGPGNFTGIRIGISAARGLALGLGVPAIGVSAFDALKYGTEGSCLCSVDARRGQVYIQTFGDSKPAAPELVDGVNLERFGLPVIGENGAEPRHTTAVAIARVAAERLGSCNARPAPLYLRPADAAPAKDAAPVILS